MFKYIIFFLVLIFPLTPYAEIGTFTPPVDYTTGDSSFADILDLIHQAPSVIINTHDEFITTENGDITDFTIALNTEPSADVIIGLASSDITEGTVCPKIITFTPTNWHIQQKVIITGVDDALDDGDMNYMIFINKALSDDARYNGLNPENLSVTNLDDDTASLQLISATGLNTTEDGDIAVFKVALTTKPLNDEAQSFPPFIEAVAEVTIFITSDDEREGIVSPETLTFTSSNFDIPQEVSVTGVDDDLIDGEIEYSILLNVIESDDADYREVEPVNVVVKNFDNESAQEKDSYETEIDQTLPETIMSNEPESEKSKLEETKVYCDKEYRNEEDLKEEQGEEADLADVYENKIEVVTQGIEEEDFKEEPGGAPGLAETYKDKAVIAINSVEGEYFEQEQSSEADFAELYKDETRIAIQAAEEEDFKQEQGSEADLAEAYKGEAGITINPLMGLETSESGKSAVVKVRLNTEPSANVVISFTSSDENEGTVSPALLEFTKDDWIDPQSVFITGSNDTVIDGAISYIIFTGPSLSEDPEYNGIDPEDICVLNQDNDKAGITVTPTRGLATSENGSIATFTIVLDSQPSDDVTVGIATSDMTEGRAFPERLVFTSHNWNDAQTVTITGIDDHCIDGDMVYSIITEAALSRDENYHNLNPDDVSVVNTNNNFPGIIINHFKELITSEKNDTAEFTVALATKPAAYVLIRMSSTDSTEGIVSPKSLIFTPDTWSIPQTVCISGIDDEYVDGDIAYLITIGAALSFDPDYNGLDPGDITVVNSDNDTVSEDGATSGVPPYGCFIQHVQ
ncbi:MAG: hypothetical protein ACMUIP_11590 [bacterium]